jgi:hypothetical protein
MKAGLHDYQHQYSSSDLAKSLWSAMDYLNNYTEMYTTSGKLGAVNGMLGCHTKKLDNGNFLYTFETPGCSVKQLMIKVTDESVIEVKGLSKEYRVQLPEHIDRNPVKKDYADGLLSLQFKPKEKTDKTIVITF